MKVVNFEKPVTNAWLALEGHRLDAPPFLSEAVEAKVRLEELHVPKDKLKDVTQAIYHAGREGRQWVQDKKHGVPFLGSTDILTADLSTLPFISKKQVDRNPRFVIQEGWTLITRSGTVGRMAYTRPEMDGMACSEHVLRVVPDITMIPPGYLYAYLSSKYGKTLVTSGTYGAIIQHIEPEHIADLPVPRFGRALEERVHELVHEAGRLRSEGAQQLQELTLKLLESAKLNRLSTEKKPVARITSSKTLQPRFDGLFHSSYHDEVLEALRAVDNVLLRELCSSIFEPPRLKRFPIAEHESALPFFGTSAIMNSDPEPSYYVSRKGLPVSFVVKSTSILIPRSGQLEGIIGTPAMPIGRVIAAAVSEDAIRVDVRDADVAGYVYLFLKSEYGQRQLKARAFGSSIPHLNVSGIGQLLVPWPSEETVRSIGRQVGEALIHQTESVHLEAEARRLVEQAIELDSEV